MSDLEVILENMRVLDSLDEVREQIAAVRADIAEWEQTIDDNNQEIAALALKSMELRIDIDRAKLEQLRLSHRLVTLQKAVIQ